MKAQTPSRPKDPGQRQLYRADGAHARYTLRTVTRAVRLLYAFAEGHETLSVAEAASVLNLDRTVVRRLLVTLSEEHLLAYDPDAGAYSLGSGILLLADALERSNPLLHTGGNAIRKLADELGHTAFLGVLNGIELVYLHVEQGNHPLRVVSRSGARRPAYAAASGKAILAFATQDIIQEVIRGGLRRHGPRTITNAEALQDELARVRVQGIAINNEEAGPGILAVGAPVRNAGGRVIAAVSVGMPKHLVPKREVQKVSARVRQVAIECSEAFGWRGTLTS